MRIITITQREKLYLFRKQSSNLKRDYQKTRHRKVWFNSVSICSATRSKQQVDAWQSLTPCRLDNFSAGYATRVSLNLSHWTRITALPLIEYLASLYIRHYLQKPVENWPTSSEHLYCSVAMTFVSTNKRPYFSDNVWAIHAFVGQFGICAVLSDTHIFYISCNLTVNQPTPVSFIYRQIVSQYHYILPNHVLLINSCYVSCSVIKWRPAETKLVVRSLAKREKDAPETKAGSAVVSKHSLFFTWR